MASLSKTIATTLALLVSAGVHADAHLASTRIEPFLERVVVGHYRGVTGNSFKEATRFYHSDSPDLARIRIELVQAEYFQKTKLLSFAVVNEGEEFSIGIATLRFLRISGIKFSEEFVDAEYHFRKEDGTWKLWTTRISPREIAIPLHTWKETTR